MKIAAYISGHGFGHAVRCSVVLSELRRLLPSLCIVIKTEVPSWLFSDLSPGAVTLIEQRVDQSPVQRDAVTLDLEKTMDGFSAWLDQRDPWIAAEATWLREEDIALVIADISPLGLSAAKSAGIPSALVANFSWDWILESLYGANPTVDSIIQPLRQYVAQADWLFMAAPSSPMAHKRPIPVGLVGRRCRLDRTAAKRALGIPEGKLAILVSFGGFGMRGIDFSPLDELNGFVFVSTQPLGGITNCRVFDPETVDHPCLMMASDVVVGKLGYGTVVEALIHGTPFLYSLRGDWPEEPVLREAVESRLPSIALPMVRLRAGTWLEELRTVTSAEPGEGCLPLGGRQIAEALAAFLVDYRDITPAYYPLLNQ